MRWPQLARQADGPHGQLPEVHEVGDQVPVIPSLKYCSCLFGVPPRLAKGRTATVGLRCADAGSGLSAMAWCLEPDPIETLSGIDWPLDVL